MVATKPGDNCRVGGEVNAKPPAPSIPTTTEYCARLQRWMWHCYWGHSHWAALSASLPSSFPPCAFPAPGTTAGHRPAGCFPTPGSGQQQALDTSTWYPYPLTFPSPHSRGGGQAEPGPTATQTAAYDARAVRQHNGTPAQPGREYIIPSALQRLLAEMVDFLILLCVKATFMLWVMHYSQMKDMAKFITQLIMDEIDESTSMGDLQRMMALALAYRVLVCTYEAICIWGAGGATPGKFLLGLRVVTCNTSTLVRPDCVLVVPATHVSLSASTVRALNKNFSIAFLFPVFVTLLFFQHNRTVYDVVAGTIVVQRRSGR